MQHTSLDELWTHTSYLFNALAKHIVKKIHKTPSFLLLRSKIKIFISNTIKAFCQHPPMFNQFNRTVSTVLMVAGFWNVLATNPSCNNAPVPITTETINTAIELVRYEEACNKLEKKLELSFLTLIGMSIGELGSVSAIECIEREFLEKTAIRNSLKAIMKYYVTDAVGFAKSYCKIYLKLIRDIVSGRNPGSMSDMIRVASQVLTEEGDEAGSIFIVGIMGFTKTFTEFTEKIGALRLPPSLDRSRVSEYARIFFRDAAEIINEWAIANSGVSAQVLSIFFEMAVKAMEIMIFGEGEIPAQFYNEYCDLNNRIGSHEFVTNGDLSKFRKSMGRMSVGEFEEFYEKVWNRILAVIATVKEKVKSAEAKNNAESNNGAEANATV